MKRICRVIPIALALLFLGCTQNPPMEEPVEPSNEPMDSPTAQAGTSAVPDRTIELQDQLDQYFHAHVLPKLGQCWGGIGGKGDIEVMFTFTRSGSDWGAAKLEKKASTLSGEQDATALKCLQEATGDTSFPADDITSASRFVAYWSWPVPMPADTTGVATRISTGGGGGACETPRCLPESCPGNNCPAANACSGRSTCTLRIERDGGRTCNFNRSDVCASGGYHFGGGGLIIY